MNFVSLACFISLCTQTTRGQLLSSPMNTIATLGERVELECSTNLTIPPRWDFEAVSSTRFDFIYLNGKISRNFSSSSYKVDTSRSGYWTLVIDSADMAYAGTYRCLTVPNYNIGEAEMSASAQLVIIDSDPTCGTNASSDGVVEGEYIEMQCTFKNIWNWFPIMECTGINGPIVDDVHYAYNSSKVTLFLIRQLTPSDNGVVFTCKMSVRQNNTNNRPAKVGETKATNIPRYQHLWNYTTHVLYGPRNQTLMLIGDAFNIGSCIECYADGNPAPSYEWEIIGRNISLNKGSIVVISESLISDEEQTLRCIAMNVVAGQIMQSETTFIFNLTAASQANGFSDQRSQTLLIIGIVSVGALILCLVIAIIIYNMNRKVVAYKVAEPQESLVQPIYAVVKKDRNGHVSNAVAVPTENSRRQQETPIYTEVKKHENEQKKTGSISNMTSPAEKKPQQNNVGADGTQYVELSLLHDQRPNAVPVQHNPMFSLVETYASIDHTLQVPPPPVPKRH